MTAATPPVELNAMRQAQWPTDEFLQKLASTEYLTLLDLNIDPTEVVTRPEIEYAKASQEQVVDKLLTDGRISLAQLAQRKPGPSKARTALGEYDDMLSHVRELDPRRRAIALTQADERGVVLPVVPGSEGGYINVRPFLVDTGTSATLREKLRQQRDSTEPSYRLYLNPPRQHVPEVAALMVKENKQQEALFNFKFADANYRDMDQRTDKIVIYVSESELSGVLELLDRVEARIPEGFSGRKLPELVYPIRKGVGIAANPPGGESYTRDRIDLATAAKREVAGQITGLAVEQQVPILRGSLGRVALGRGIDPTNIALNAQ